MTATTELERRAPGLSTRPQVYVDDRTPDGCVTVGLAYDQVDVPAAAAAELAVDLLLLVGATSRLPREEMLQVFNRRDLALVRAGFILGQDTTGPR